MAALSFGKVNQQWFFKYKLYHIPFWFVYHYIWWVVAMGNPFTAASNILFTPFFVKFIFYLVFQALAVYFNLYFLIPKFLERGKFTAYIALLLLTIFCTASLIVPGYFLSAVIAEKDDGGAIWRRCLRLLAHGDGRAAILHGRRPYICNEH
jgi:two-component system LytT family sensor kinase